MKLKILTNGIYFHQTDIKEIGYYTSDKNGNLIHHEYKKPTIWERSKYYLKYGYEYNDETLQTSYFIFSKDLKSVHHNLMIGDAVSVARDARLGKYLRKGYDFLENDNIISFIIDDINLNINISLDGREMDVFRVNIKNHKEFPVERFTFLDWNNL